MLGAQADRERVVCARIVFHVPRAELRTEVTLGHRQFVVHCRFEHDRAFDADVQVGRGLGLHRHRRPAGRSQQRGLTRRTVDPDQYWQEYYASKPKYIQYLNLPKRFLKRLPIFNSSQFHMFRWLQRRSEADIFWSDEAVHYYPDFKIADVPTGLRFAFEVSPRLCLERNHNQLPFGRHAWARYDRAFWEPYLLKVDLPQDKKLIAAGESA